MSVARCFRAGVYGAKSSYPIHGIGPESCRRTSGVAGGGGSAAPGWGVIVRLWRHQCACDCRGSWFGWGGHGFGPRGCWRFRWWGGGVGDFGKTASALAAQAGRLGRYVRARPALDVVDVGYSLVSTRSVFDHRAVVVGQTRDELLAGLAGVVAGRPEAGVVCGVGKPAGKTALCLPVRARSGWVWVASFMLPTRFSPRPSMLWWTSWTGTCGIRCAM